MNNELIADIINWDIRTLQRALFYWENNVDWNKIKIALELGSRQGGLSLWLALKGKKVICSDIENPQETAKEYHQKYNTGNLIEYRAIDATCVPYESYFDLIVFKSVIGAIGKNGGLQKQQQVFSEIYKALKPGGYLLYAENLTATPLHIILRKMFVKWGKEWRYVSIDEMKTFLKDFSYFDIETTGFIATLGRNERQRSILSILDEIIFNRICPAKWKYIAYGLGIK